MKYTIFFLPIVYPFLYVLLWQVNTGLMTKKLTLCHDNNDIVNKRLKVDKKSIFVAMQQTNQIHFIIN